MTNFPINMFIKIFCAAILRLAEVKDQLIKDIEHKKKDKRKKDKSG